MCPLTSHPKIGELNGEPRKKRRGKHVSVLSFDDELVLVAG